MYVYIWYVSSLLRIFRPTYSTVGAPSLGTFIGELGPAILRFKRCGVVYGIKLMIKSIHSLDMSIESTDYLPRILVPLPTTDPYGISIASFQIQSTYCRKNVAGQKLWATRTICQELLRT